MTTPLVMKVNMAYLLMKCKTEYQQVIKKYKSKCKVLEIEYAKLKASNNELIVRHNEVVETHDTSIVPSKQLKEEHDKLLVKHDELNVKYEEVVVHNKSLTSCNKKLKLDYTNLSMKYQELDLAFDALDEELKETQKKVIEVNIATCGVASPYYFSSCFSFLFKD